MQKYYLCIDLKTFYASVECVERGLDPFNTNLVVADPERGKGTICLAISPKMKMLGVKNRCRIFEIPPTIKYIVATPRMKRYLLKIFFKRRYTCVFNRRSVYGCYPIFKIVQIKPNRPC